MLTRLELRDIAIVDRLELELETGVTVLTGETGAGKSILIDALGLALGERARQSMVRAGAARAEVVAVFELSPTSPAAGWLREHELDNAEADCVLRRTVAADGRSRAYINDRSVPMQTLRDLGDLLVDIHGQHAHQSLLRRPAQREALDAHAAHPETLRRLADLHVRWRELTDAMEADGGGKADREDRLEFLRYQVRELETVSPELDELETLADEHRRLSHREDLRATCARALGALEGEGEPSAISLVAAAARAVSEMIAFDPGLGEIAELLDNATIQMDEATGRLRRYAEQLDVDPQRLTEVDSRLGELHAVARKHRVAPEELMGLLDKLTAEIEFLERSEERLSQRSEELGEVVVEYRRHRPRGESSPVRSGPFARRCRHRQHAAPRAHRRALRDRCRGRFRSPAGPARRGPDRVPGKREPWPTGAPARPGRLRRGAVARQPRDTGARDTRLSGADTDIR